MRAALQSAVDRSCARAWCLGGGSLSSRLTSGRRRFIHYTERALTGARRRRRRRRTALVTGENACDGRERPRRAQRKRVTPENRPLAPARRAPARPRPASATVGPGGGRGQKDCTTNGRGEKGHCGTDGLGGERTVRRTGGGGEGLWDGRAAVAVMVMEDRRTRTAGKFCGYLCAQSRRFPFRFVFFFPRDAKKNRYFLR